MVKTPLTVCSDEDSHWIEDCNGETLLSVDPMVASAEALRLAEFAAHALAYLATVQENCRRIQPLGAALAGRPRIYKPRELIKPPKQRGRPRRVKKPNGG